MTLDLPPEVNNTMGLSSDAELVASRHLLSTTKALGLRRYTQLLGDSLWFDATPHTGTVDLGLIDAAHDVVHVQNDTAKVARMMSAGGIVFWHEYGGEGSLRPQASYLERLVKRCSLYRICGTTLAWGRGGELKAALGLD